MQTDKFKTCLITITLAIYTIEYCNHWKRKEEGNTHTKTIFLSVTQARASWLAGWLTASNLMIGLIKPSTDGG